MRCMLLAQALKENGASVVFISRMHTGNLNHLISKKGFQVVELNQPESEKSDKRKNGGNCDNYREWLGVSEMLDAEETVLFLNNDKPEWLIVDHYALGKKWEKHLRPYVNNIMVIDDLANRKHDCDMLLDQNWFENMETRYDGIVPAGCTKLLGPEYALLRSEFSEARKTLKPRNGKIKRIFVFFGGSDPYNLTAMTLRALSEPELSHLEVDVVIGENNTHRDKVQQLVKSRDGTYLNIQVNNMATIMKKADIAIGSGGATTWERMCLNLESHVIIAADNQKEVNEHLNNNNYIRLIGYSDSMNSMKLSMHIKERILINSLKSRSDDFTSLCDGCGVDRIIKEIRSIQKNSLTKFTNANV